MMKKRKTTIYILILIIAAVLTGVLVFVRFEYKPVITDYSLADRPPAIWPDYTQIVLPANIAPLNFKVKEKGDVFFVKIYSKDAKPIEIFSKSGKIIIPQKAWRKLLSENRGKELFFDVFIKTKEGNWNKFQSISNKIADEDIDSFIVYRKIYPLHRLWREMGIYQRNLENFKESVVLHNKYFRDGCINCHTFCNNKADKMLIATRSDPYGSGTLLFENGKVDNINTKFSYMSWHPKGKMVTYSVNEVDQFFHSAKPEIRDVIDYDSLIACYFTDSKTVQMPSEISARKILETYPAWSPDGRYLYFCSAPIFWENSDDKTPEKFNEIKYSLMRAGYDLANNKWTTPEIVLSAEQTGKSILEPRVSPDGRWLLFCMCDYGCFPVYQQSSDLYLMDLQAAEKAGEYKYRKLAINSSESESWHSWSSNSRWIAFSSKKGNDLFTRIYLSYVDRDGTVYKPFVLCQKDPEFYDYYLQTFSVPELITQAVKVNPEQLGKAIRGNKKINVTLPQTMATPKAGKAPPSNEPWQQRE